MEQKRDPLTYNLTIHSSDESKRSQLASVTVTGLELVATPVKHTRKKN